MQIIETLVLGFALVSAAVLFTLYGFLFGRYSERLRLRQKRGESDEWIVPPQPREHSNRIAQERRSFLSSYLDRVSDDEIPQFEIREIPPGYEAYSLRELSRPEAAAQLAALQWQMARPELLALGRVADAIAFIGRDNRIEARELSPHLGLRRVQELPWRGFFGYGDAVGVAAKLETLKPEIARKLADLKSWLGIGVVMTPSPEFIAEYGRCLLGGTGEGVVGGEVVSASSSSLLVTCAHVLSTSCQSKQFAADLVRDTFEPDAALIRPGATCFQTTAEFRDVDTADAHDALRMTRSESHVTIPHRKMWKRHGIIGSPAAIVTYGGRTHHFPHTHIHPHYRKWFDLFVWPPWASTFCGPGDSGSWVLEPESNKWVGMVVGGAPGGKATYIVNAEPLLQYLSKANGVALSARIATQE